LLRGFCLCAAGAASGAVAAGTGMVEVVAEAVDVGVVWGAAFGALLFEQPTTAKTMTRTDTTMIAEIIFKGFPLLSYPG
jgi:hypothetical protein